jgi:hypothetical protein
MNTKTSILTKPMPTETRLNIRVKPELKSDLEHLAEFHGLTLSSYVHSILIKTVRREKEVSPEAFEPRGVPTIDIHLSSSTTSDQKKTGSGGNR